MAIRPFASAMFLLEPVVGEIPRGARGLAPLLAHQLEFMNRRPGFESSLGGEVEALERLARGFPRRIVGPEVLRHPQLPLPTSHWVDLLNGGRWEEGGVSGRVIFGEMPVDSPIRIGVKLVTIEYPGRRYHDRPWRGLAYTLYRAEPRGSGKRPNYQLDTLRVTRTVLAGIPASCSCAGAGEGRTSAEYLELAYQPGTLDPDLLGYREKLTDGASLLFSRRGPEGGTGSPPFTFLR